MSLIEEGLSLPLIIFSWGWFHLFSFHLNGFSLSLSAQKSLLRCVCVWGKDEETLFLSLPGTHPFTPPILSFGLSHSLSLQPGLSLDNKTLPCQVVRKSCRYHGAMHLIKREGQAGCVTMALCGTSLLHGDNSLLFPPEDIPWEYCFISFTLLWTPDSSRSLKNSAEMKIYYLAG